MQLGSFDNSFGDLLSDYAEPTTTTRVERQGEIRDGVGFFIFMGCLFIGIPLLIKFFE